MTYYQVLIPMQPVDERTNQCYLNGDFGRHLATTKTLMAYRKRKYYQNIAILIKKWVMLCEQCIRDLQIDNTLTRQPRQNHSEHIRGPEDAMQIDLFLKLLPSGRYGNLVTDMYMPFRFVFLPYNESKC